MKKTLFLTGSTGLVGSYLLKLFIKNNCKVYALARRKNNMSASRRVNEVLGTWDNDRIDYKNNINLEIIEGDLRKKNLGLNKNVIKKMTSEVDEIFHCAAETKFNSSPEDLKDINVKGSERIFEIGLRCKKDGRLKKINYLSTIYICGNYAGHFSENDLDVGQEFKTVYEQSKFESEKLANEYRDKVHIDIFRPPVIVGESESGKIISFQQAFYQALRIWNSEIFDYFPNVKEIPFYLVFIDELCKSIYNISCRSTDKNKNYHIFNHSCPTLDKILNLTTQFLGLKKTSYIRYSDFISKSTPIQKKLVEYNFLFLNNKVKLVSDYTNKILSNINFRLSDFNDSKFIQLLEYAVRKGFLTKK